MVNGQGSWLEMLNSVPRKHWPRYHRFTPQLDGLMLRDGVIRCVGNILASLFYIRLDCLPVFAGSRFTCKAKILCRLDPDSRELHALLSRLKANRARLCIQSTKQIPCYTQVLYNNPFCMPIEFCVSSMSDEVDVEIDGLAQRAHSISNCPYKLSDLVVDQGLHLIFGRPDHQRRLLPMCTPTGS